MSWCRCFTGAGALRGRSWEGAGNKVVNSRTVRVELKNSNSETVVTT